MAKIFIIGNSSFSIRNFRGELIKMLVEEGHSVVVAAPDISSNFDTLNWLKEINVKFSDLPMQRTGLNPFSDIWLMIIIYLKMRKFNPDIFLGYTAKPVIWGLIAAWLAGVERSYALITGLGYAFIAKRKSVKRTVIRQIVSLLYSFSLSKASAVIFQNSDDLQEFRNLKLITMDTNAAIVNGSGVNLSKFQKVSFPSFPTKFLLIARLLGDKGVREFVGAAQIIKQANLDAEFHLVGPIDSNPDAIKIEEVGSWCKRDIIKWHGRLDDVRQAIAECHVFVLPSYREGTPRTVLEAMAMGRPIITTNAPGCRQTVVDGKNGFLVPVRDPASLANAMKEFIFYPELVEVMGCISREHVIEKFDVVDVNRNMLSYMSLN